MSVNLKDAVVVIHPQLTVITDDAVERALEPARFSANTRMERLEVRGLALNELAELDWGREHDLLTREIERIRPALQSSRGLLLYFGMAPIPLAMELGNRIANTRDIYVFQQRHDTKEWCWESAASTVDAALEGKPAAVCRARGDVVVRVSCSHPVSADDTRQVVCDAIGELDISVPRPHEDILKSEQDVRVIAALFGEALDCVRHYFPNCVTIHAFTAVPAGLAFCLGAEINATIHCPVQTYQYSGRSAPRYTPAIVVGERPRPRLTSQQRKFATTARDHFSSALAQLSEWTESTRTNVSESPSIGAGALSGMLARVGTAARSRALVGATVAPDHEVPNGEFHWAPKTQTWRFDDTLLAALAITPDIDIQQAARLFFLHETMHIEAQGVTTATAEGVGRFPRILEEVDYVADVCAIWQELQRAVATRDVSEAGAAKYVRELVATMTSLFWAFDAASIPLRTIQVRRLNRYLLWYWQTLRLETAVSLNEAFAILSEKPVLEVVGPRLVVSRGRVLLDLDPTFFEDVQFGALVDGSRIERVGSRSGAHAGRLLVGLRSGDQNQFIEALRGIFDSVHAGQR